MLRIAARNGSLLGHEPTFDRVEVNLGDRDDSERRVTVVPHGTGPYIAAAELDGAPLEHAWFEWPDVRDGAVLEVTRSEEPTDWGR